MKTTFKDKIIINNGKKSISRQTPRYNIGNCMDEWVNKNISTEWSLIGVADSIVDVSNGGRSTDSVYGPHTDISRQYVLMYLIAADNADQETVFYQEPGSGVRRKKGIILQNIDRLIEIEKFIAPMHTWVYFDASVLHSVRNILGKRTALQISFDCEPFGIFVKGDVE
jgi:hypothetical protein